METVLKAQRRDDHGKGAARKLRAQGLVPGILYGGGMEPQPIALSSQDLLHFFHATHGATTVVDIEIDGSTQMAIAREVQRDHLRGRFIHIDFLAVRRDEKVKMTVEIHEQGEAPGIKTGGVLEHHLREVEIECLPGDVPEGVVAEIGSLELGDMLRVGDIVAPTGVTILTDPGTPVISVVTPAALRTEADLGLPGEEGVEGVEEAPAAEAEAPEVEVEAEAPADEG